MNNPPPAVLPRDVEAQVREHAEAAYPHEACGAIFGRGDGSATPWRISSVSAAPNEHGDDRTRRYLVPPQFQLRAEREARAHDVEVLGYYHSHPDHPALPSEYDRAHAWAGYLYLICSVQQGRSTQLNGFTLDTQGGVFLGVALRDAPEG